MTIVIDNVDLGLLNTQRLALVDMLYGNSDSELWGLVEMLDDVIDRYGDAL